MRKLTLIILVLLIAVTAGLLVVTRDKTSQNAAMEAQDTPSASAIGGHFTLTDQNGKPAQDTDFRGKIMLVYFGFTRCPDMCPLSMGTMAKALPLLGDKANDVVPIFISVDPDYDTPDKVKEYVAAFGPQFIGLTGSAEDVKKVAALYKTYYAKSNLTQEEAQAANSTYTVDHSGYIFMMGKNGDFIRLFPYNISEQELASGVKTALDAKE